MGILGAISSTAASPVCCAVADMFRAAAVCSRTQGYGQCWQRGSSTFYLSRIMENGLIKQPKQNHPQNRTNGRFPAIARLLRTQGSAA